MFLPKHPIKALGRGLVAVALPTVPLLAQMVVTRRCNLSCGYCNEYDNTSSPIPIDILKAQIDQLNSFGTLVLTLTGGEPLLHPELDAIVLHATSKGMVCTSISNGYPITRSWVARLNKANLTLLQLSIDNLEPNEVSEKSLSKIKNKLELLRKEAKFGVNINAVLGSCPPDHTRKLVDIIDRLGFFMTVGLMHDKEGQLDPGLAGEELSDLYEEMRSRSRKSFFHRFGEGWEQRMIRDHQAPWKCRAGARYLYIDEFGKVSYCSQRRGEPGTPLLDYSKENLRTAFSTVKGCEDRCTIACVRRASSLDGWRRYDLQ